MLGSGGDDLEGPPPEDLRAARSSIYIGTPDVEAIHARAREAGTEVSDLFDQDYGSRDFQRPRPGRQPLDRSGPTLPGAVQAGGGEPGLGVDARRRRGGTRASSGSRRRSARSAVTAATRR